MKSSLDAFLNLIYPPVCQICGDRRAGIADGYVCESCYAGTRGVRFIKPPFCERCGLPYEGEISADFTCSNCDGVNLQFKFARSSVVAKNLVLDVIHRYKYQVQVWFEPFLIGLLEKAAKPWLEREHWNLLVPVPLYPAKERERGFNQARRLAAGFRKFSGLPLNDSSVVRVKSTQTQTRLSQKERMQNVHNAFRCIAPAQVKGKKVILIDDVMTTGATTNACAASLKKAGADDVCVWTVARGV